MRRAVPAAALARAALFAAAVPAMALAPSLPATAQADPKPARDPNPAIEFFRWLESLVGSTSLAALIVVIVLPAIGYVLKWGFDEWKASNAKRRDFVAKTSDKVVGLAWGHYWGLANATGTLAGALTNHLRMVDAHLLVVWDGPKALRDRMDEIAGQTTRESFVSFVRLLYAFEGFQFRGSNTYLLPHHAAGETLRRLYNRFVESLGADLVLLLPEVRLAVERKTSTKDKDGHEPPPDLGSAQFERNDWFTVADEDWPKGKGDRPRAAADLKAAELQDWLSRARQGYEAWLRDQPAAVAEAAEALRAFSRLLTHELATLHEVWHRDRGPFAVREAWRQAQGAVSAADWPGVLDQGTVETMRRARAVSPFFAPLGMGQKAGTARREKAEPSPAMAVPAPPQDPTPEVGAGAAPQPPAAAPAAAPAGGP
jgi:hypothetical protein